MTVRRSALVAAVGGLAVAGALLLGAGTAGASSPTTVPPTTAPPGPTVPLDPSNGLPAAAGPLVQVPAGCVAPPPPQAVFEGSIVDAVTTTARFRVERLLSGSLDGYEVGGLVDVRYADQTRFLTIGDRYLVGVAASSADGALVSTVREAAPLFGGDAVVGLNDSDVDCPQLPDPVRTLLPDGTPVDSGVLAPLKDHGASLASAVARPVVAALAVLLVLVIVKHLLFAFGRALRDLGSAPTVDRRRRHEAG